MQPPVHTASPAWLDRQAYPFRARFFESAAGRLHYVDEGRGAPIVMLHGTPTWSFLYRHLIRALAPTHRCIAPDLLGFGRSDKPHGWSYRPEDHAVCLAQLLDHLDLQELTLVVHDWGGPIGLSYALDRPERVRRLVIMNSWMWPLEDLRFRLFSAFFGGASGRLLAERLNAFTRVVLPLVAGGLSPAVHRQYLAPLADPAARKGTWVFPQALTAAAPWLASLWARRQRLAGKPTLLLWGLQDPAFTVAELRRWQQLFPEARTVTFSRVGHYLQEQMGAALPPHVIRFLAATT